MPTPITIRMNSNGTYTLDPPFVVITPSDQGITWNLTGANWQWQTPNGIICEANPPNPPYSGWPSNATGPTLNTTTNQYTASANSPNQPSSTWIYYKWTFNVINSSTGQTVTVDPDIGNEPQP
jgi:hypothetical protein